MGNYSFDIEELPTFDEIIVQRGLDAYNHGFGLEPITELTAFVRDENGVVKGGVYGEVFWNWLYVDLLWVSPELHEKGYGEKLLTSIEQGALSHGAEKAYLSTTSFQALPFYHRVGYQLFGVLEDRPPGYNYYYLYRPIPFIDDLNNADLLPITQEPEAEDLQAVKQGLSQHNRSKGINPDGRRLAVFLRTNDDAHRVVGGLIGATYWGWLDIQVMWLDESLRGQGHGLKLLQLAEEEATKRGCMQAFTDVADFQTLAFFHRQSYVTFTTLENRPPGHTTHFLRKILHS